MKSACRYDRLILLFDKQNGIFVAAIIRHAPLHNLP